MEQQSDDRINLSEEYDVHWTEMSDKKMNQTTFLSQTLWQYSEASAFTDVILVCKDGKVEAHSAIISPFGLSGFMNEENPNYLLVPDFSTAEVRSALRALYLNSDASPFKSLLGVIDNPKKEDELSSCSDSVFLAVEQPSKESSSDEFKSDLDNQAWSNEGNLNDKKLADENQEPESRDPLKQNFQWHCELCGDQFLEQNVLVVHMKKCRSRSERRSKKKSKEERYQIKKERRKTYSKRRTVCELCSKRVTIVYLKQHLKICEKNNLMTKHDFNCNECALGKYKTKESLERHVFKCHSGLVYKCDFCDFTTSTPQGKRLHLVSMHLAKTLKCNHCDKMFSKEYRLRVHNKEAHEKVKNKQCPHCDEAFKDHRAFEAHVNRHTDNRPYGCKTCGKTYLAKTHLAVHAKCHTLPKLCEQCDLRFGRADALKKHIRLVHEQQQVKCRHGCGWSCWETRGRGRHEKTCRFILTLKVDLRTKSG